jgi:hypothetical protein
MGTTKAAGRSADARWRILVAINGATGKVWIVRITLGKPASGHLLTVLATWLFLAAAAQTWAQAAKRSFQMALWPDTTIAPTASDGDIKTFWELYGEPAAPARSVMFIQTWKKNAALPAGYDWSRILAVQIDEPYITTLVAAGLGVGDNPCYDTTGRRLSNVNETMKVLKQEAAMINAISPSTRFWINFDTSEVEWMEDTACPLPLNQPYIDVVSLYHYDTQFSPAVQSYYDWFSGHPAKASQQLALVPGTYYLIPKVSPPGPDPQDDPDSQASILQGYFDYANKLNQNCNLSLGPRGHTWNFDGCRVWIVMGWLAGNTTNGTGEYVGELDPRSGPIRAAWRQEARLVGGQILQNLSLPVVRSEAP